MLILCVDRLVTMRFSMYEFQGPNGWERLEDEIAALLDSENDDQADAGIDFLEALKHLARGGDVPARQLPGILWRHLLEPEAYLLARDAYRHSLYLTQRICTQDFEVRALLAAGDDLPTQLKVPVVVERHRRSVS